MSTSPMLNLCLFLLVSLQILFPEAVRGDLVAPNALTLTISANATHAVRMTAAIIMRATNYDAQIPSTLYGYMWEVC